MKTIASSIRRLAVPLALALSTLGLSGCVGLDIAYALYQTQNSIVSDLVPAEPQTELASELGQATPVAYKPYVYRKGQDCRSHAYVLPYDRTWPEEIIQDDNQVFVNPPKPGVVAGYVAVVYKKSCPEEQDQQTLRAGLQGTGTGDTTIWMRPFSDDQRIFVRSTLDYTIDTRDMIDRGSVERPQWWPQVVGRLVLLAQTDPQVKAALLSNLDQFVEASPEHAEALRALEG